MVLLTDRSTGISNDDYSKVSIMTITSNTRNCEIGRDSGDDDRIDPLFSEVFLETCLVKWTHANFRESHLILSMIEFCEKLGRPCILAQYPCTWSS